MAMGSTEQAQIRHILYDNDNIMKGPRQVRLIHNHINVCILWSVDESPPPMETNLRKAVRIRARVMGMVKAKI